MIWKSGFFEPLIEEICVRIKSGPTSKNERMYILDAGCGEGSSLSSLREKISAPTTNDFLGIGMDISREGIDLASQDNTNLIWCIGDIANSPFEANQFHFILNILSPSNYAEFKRILTDDGRVIKVIPEKNYLHELRNLFYEHTDKQIYSNQKSLERFRDHFKLLDVKRIQYRITLNSTLIKPLIQMTPLSWRATDMQLQQLLDANSKTITVDLAILLGKPH
ncbi:methyltransferase domain-containing protein [Shimazuella sp. AN120528]|uniref:methyltransferase domain-containing protein n=1 Tax=Shimazuella soli TaxID=1892854 RepID=UPI001F0FBF2C|nr:methyltransferase domain-containing protein [Shimazuella soli]MCH5584259.1 methyltransferase domain-containing protein [Shimazuella soli]